MNDFYVETIIILLKKKNISLKYLNSTSCLVFQMGEFGLDDDENADELGNARYDFIFSNICFYFVWYIGIFGSWIYMKK